MIITGDDPQAIYDLQCYLSTHFEMKDLRALSNYFLGLRVTTYSSVCYLSQAKYAFDLLARSGITNSITFSTPLESNVCLTPSDGVLLEHPYHYRYLARNVIYLTVTRLDIYCLCSSCCQEIHVYSPHNSFHSSASYPALY